MEPRELAQIVPEIGDAEMAYPAGGAITKTFDTLTPEAVQWEKKNPDHWALFRFDEIFYKGGKPPEVMSTPDGTTREDAIRVFRWVWAAMGSYYPKHEHKRAVCGLLWASFFKDPEDLQ